MLFWWQIDNILQRSLNVTFWDSPLLYWQRFQNFPLLLQKHLQDAAFSSNYIGVQQALDKTKEKTSEIKGLKRKVDEAKKSKVLYNQNTSTSILSPS